MHTREATEYAKTVAAEAQASEKAYAMAEEGAMTGERRNSWRLTAREREVETSAKAQGRREQERRKATASGSARSSRAEEKHTMERGRERARRAMARATGRARASGTSARRTEGGECRRRRARRQPSRGACTADCARAKCSSGTLRAEGESERAAWVLRPNDANLARACAAASVLAPLASNGGISQARGGMVRTRRRSRPIHLRSRCSALPPRWGRRRLSFCCREPACALFRHPQWPHAAFRCPHQR